MNTSLNRRAALSAAGAVGLAGVAGLLRAAAAESTPVEASFAGAWTYRSFLSNPDIDIDFGKLEFARASLLIERTPFGALRGRLNFGDDGLDLKGSVTYGHPFAARFQGRGASEGTKGWVYDYLGFLVPAWPDGVGQRPAIVGTVIRTVQQGMSRAGVVASFIAVKRDDK